MPDNESGMALLSAEFSPILNPPHLPERVDSELSRAFYLPTASQKQKSRPLSIAQTWEEGTSQLRPVTVALLRNSDQRA
ncbi:MAG: hypothetical protein ACPG8W_02370 [Candidatus Promineifilaceae bacterium]